MPLDGKDLQRACSNVFSTHSSFARVRGRYHLHVACFVICSCQRRLLSWVRLSRMSMVRHQSLTLAIAQ